MSSHVLSAHHADCDGNVEKFTEEEVEGVLVELVVDVLHEQIQKLHQFLLVVVNNSAWKCFSVEIEINSWKHQNLDGL